MKKISAIGLGLFILFGCIHQELTAQNLTPAARRNPMFTDLMNGLPIARPASNTVGDIYFNERPALTTISLFENSQPIEGVYARYNIYFDELDVKTQNGERAIESSRIKRFVFQDTISSAFVNAREYNSEGVPLKGFLEVLAEGPASLFKHHYLFVKAPDYNPALNAGSRDTKIYKKYNLYCSKGNDLIVIKGKKKLLEFFGDKKSEIDQYMKANTLVASEEPDLIKIFNYYNSIVSN